MGQDTLRRPYRDGPVQAARRPSGAQDPARGAGKDAVEGGEPRLEGRNGRGDKGPGEGAAVLEQVRADEHGALDEVRMHCIPRYNVKKPVERRAACISAAASRLFHNCTPFVVLCTSYLTLWRIQRQQGRAVCLLCRARERPLDGPVVFELQCARPAAHRGTRCPAASGRCACGGIGGIPRGSSLPPGPQCAIRSRR